MWLKNILQNKRSSITRFFITVIIFISVFPLIPFSDELNDERPSINIIYPKKGQMIRAADSTFIFGNISPYDKNINWQLRINDSPINIHEDGGFLAFLPIKPDTFNFFISAERPETDSEKKLWGKIPGHYKSDDSLSRTITKTARVARMARTTSSSIIVKPFDALIFP